MSPLSTTLAAIAAAAVIEAAMAGGGTRAVLKSLRQPRWSPPFALWVAIGLAYYLIFGAILYRLLRGGGGGWTAAAIGLVGLILLANGATNWLLFRRRDLSAFRRTLLPYGLLVAALLALLLANDAKAALILSPYLAYLPFAYAWVRALERLNPAAER